MSADTYNMFLVVVAVAFALSFLLTAYRILAGPNSVDRILGLDGMSAMLQCSLATYICYTLDTTISNAMIVVALLGFIATVSVARFRKRDS